ncbi:cobyric acid synthase [Aliiroseovarius sp.]|uniref:cobyric acid synthase n=1 Tax=Aliiroseovarius sp. TaxID=1872442 RepID=UPI002630486D|nr:cobyric acid synthase [Aliiroseovarius sp.]
MTKALMIQGTGSNVGKSMLVAGLARACVNRGLKVAPFKPQNMSNNAAVTADGGEIGRAQALQAMACRLEPHSDMNPVLLKPESETGAQVVVQGQRYSTTGAMGYGQLKARLLPKVLESFERLKAGADLVLVEGAGSPAETNLRPGDIANMGFAEAAGVPVVLAGDIDRGGVIAQLVGTQAVLTPEDAGRIKGYLVNKFRGDPRLFEAGDAEIARRTGWAPLGVLPWFRDSWRLPAEDVLDIASRAGGAVKVAVPQLARISNFDDLDPLAAEPEVTVELVPPGRPLPADAALVLIPGSKSTITDLAFFRQQGWDIDLKAHLRRRGRVLGICGGYQMLGHEIADPEGVEGAPGTTRGLGLLDVTTTLEPAKTLSLTEATWVPTGDAVRGYEIHLGRTQGPDCARNWLTVGDRPEGAVSADGLVQGTYLHGLFSADRFRAGYLAGLGAEHAGASHDQQVEDTLDALAAHMEAHLDIDRLLSLAT